MAGKINGTGVALVTPFRNHGTIDFTSLGKLIEHVIAGDVDFIVALGTTSEAATMSKDERVAAMDYIVETVDGRVPIIMGVGGNNTQGVIDTIKSIAFDGIDGILSVAPYYNKPQQKGIYYHFKNIAAASPVPVIIYNVPGRTSSNISAELTLRLANEFSNIIAVKEASGDLVQIMDIIQHKPAGFKVFSGDDALTFPMMMLGGEGVISVVANAYPKEFSMMVRESAKGSEEKARVLHYSLLQFINAIFEDGNPSGIKAALEVMGLCSNNLRLPLVKVNKGTFNKIQSMIEKFKAPAF
ncbi:MAG: 4-hydroxy-tetrahydrodipicolinate synthase [Bacteroidota bacterium]|nr:4-hydroxy-tetrahydrodipicolinate synthase [Bacteroidota bacterium]